MPIFGMGFGPFHGSVDYIFPVQYFIGIQTEVWDKALGIFNLSSCGFRATAGQDQRRPLWGLKIGGGANAREEEKPKIAFLRLTYVITLSLIRNYI